MKINNLDYVIEDATKVEDKIVLRLRRTQPATRKTYMTVDVIVIEMSNKDLAHLK